MQQQSNSSSRQQRQFEKLKWGERVAGTWVIVTLLLSAGLFVVGTFSGATAMVADALYNVGDLGAMFSAWFALRISQRKPGSRFKYGYYKAENLATLFIAVFISYEAIQLLFEGYSGLFVLPEITAPVPALIAALVSVAVHFFMMRHLFRVGKAIDSQALIVNARERRVCIFSSLIVFITVLLAWYKVPYVEGIVTILISIFVLRIGFYAAKESIYVLMDVSPGESVEKKIREIITSTPDVASFADLRLRRSGPFIFGEVSIQLEEGHMRMAHEIADQLENRILDTFEQVNSFTIHIEPHEAREKKVVLPIMEDKGLDSEVAERFRMANYFIFVILDGAEERIKDFTVETNPFKAHTIRAGLAASNAIIKKDVSVFIGKKIGEISFHTLRDHQIDLYEANGKTVREVISRFMKNRLSRMTDHTYVHK